MTPEEQIAYEFLKEAHTISKQMGLSDSEIIKISITNGDIPRAAMQQYCDDYNEPHPFWCK